MLDAPVGSENDPRAHTYIVDRLAPGTTITRHVRVVNSTAATARIALYPAAASISGGQFRFGAGRSRNDLTSWTTVSPSGSVLAAGASADATVRIAIPTDANHGEQYAVIWAEVSSAAPTAGGIREVNRVGVRVYLDVSGTREPSTFAITRIAAGRDPSGRPKITAMVTNTGQRALDIGGTIGLSAGPGGLTSPALRIDSTVTIASGDSQPVTSEFDRQLPRGPWFVTVALASGTVHNQATATAMFPLTVAGPGTVSVTHPSGQAWLPWLLGSTAALLLLIVLFWFLLRRRRRREPVPTS